MSWVWYNYARFHQKGTNNGKKSRLALKSVFLDLKSSDFRWKWVLFSSGIRVFFKLGNRHDARFGREWRGGGVRPNKHYYEQTVAVVWDATTFMRRHYNAKACPKTDISRAITLIMEIVICCLQKKFYPYDVRPLVNLSQWCFTIIIIIIILLTHEKPNKAYESYTHSQVQTMNRIKQLYA